MYFGFCHVCNFVDVAYKRREGKNQSNIFFGFRFLVNSTCNYFFGCFLLAVLFANSSFRFVEFSIAKKVRHFVCVPLSIIMAPLKPPSKFRFKDLFASKVPIPPLLLYLPKSSHACFVDPILLCYVVVAIVVDLEQDLEPPKFIIKK